MRSALLDLLYPAECVGCGDATGPLCARCRGDPVSATAHAPDPCPAGFPPTWAAAGYDGAIRTALLSYKERGRRDLARDLGALLAVAVAGATDAPSVVLVPVPSSRSAARARGGDHVARLARTAVRELRGRRRAAVLAPVLRARSSRPDAVGLSAAQRLRSRTDAFELSRRTVWRAGAAMVIVDDLVTTGATLTAAAHALDGLPVVGAAVIAATARRG